MSPETPTPETDAAQMVYRSWECDVPVRRARRQEPPDGWATARSLERRLATLQGELEEARREWYAECKHWQQAHEQLIERGQECYQLRADLRASTEAGWNVVVPEYLVRAAQMGNYQTEFEQEAARFILSLTAPEAGVAKAAIDA